MKKVFYFLLVAMLCGVFVGCSKDDSGEISKDNYKNAIVGEWSIYKDEITYEDEEDVEVEYYEEGEFGIRLIANGKGCWLLYGECVDSFSWEVLGTDLYIRYDIPADDGELIRIERLTKTELVVSYNEDGERTTEYYKRVN